MEGARQIVARHTTKPEDKPDVPAKPPVTYTYRAVPLSVTDGDTLILVIDIGFRITATMPVRLTGVDAPEMSTDAGHRAKAYVQNWLAVHAAPVPYPFNIVTDKDPEKYGRWLARIIADDGHVLNNDLLADGHGRPYFGGKR